MDLLLHSPPGNRERGWSHCRPSQGELPGEGVRLYVHGAGTVGEGELQTAHEACSPSLARVQPSSRVEIRQVFVVSPNNERWCSPLQPVPVLLQDQNQRQQLLVPQVMITLCGREPTDRVVNKQ